MASNEIKPFYERKKRLYSHIEENSDEEVDNEEDNMDPYEESKKRKSKLKKISSSNQFQTLREMRMMKRYNNKENAVLSQDQLEFAKKVVELKNPDTSNIKADKKFTNLIQSNTSNFSLAGVAISFNDEILSFLGSLCSCEYKIIKNDNECFTLQVYIEKNKTKFMKFNLNFNKTEEKEFVEYLPIITTFDLEGEDKLFFEEIYIHKGDLAKFMKKLLVYKSV